MRFSEGNPPEVEAHSKVKLDLLHWYLTVYLQKLAMFWPRSELKLTLVDGFAGAGQLAYGCEIIEGSPLVMLGAGDNAERTLNLGREIPIEFDIRYRFAEKNKDRFEGLKKSLASAGHQVDGKKISVFNASFESVADGIISEIFQQQPKSGRSLFLLDQTGYSQVELSLVKRILDKLPHAEVILTFAMDALLNFMQADTERVRAYSSIELTEPRIKQILALKDEHGSSWKALAQRFVMRHIQSTLQPLRRETFHTPFIMRPTSGRSLWFIHISRHPTARNVMVQGHWVHARYCGHFGPASHGILGFDSLVSGVPELFDFRDELLPKMQSELLEHLPERLYNLATDESITVDSFRRDIANDTAARFSDIDSTLIELMKAGEVVVVDSKGKKRRMNSKILRPTDRIAVPFTLLSSVPRGKKRMG